MKLKVEVRVEHGERLSLGCGQGLDKREQQCSS